MIAYIALLALIVGLLVYVLSSHPKIAELGRLLFACAALVTLLTLANQTVRIFAR